MNRPEPDLFIKNVRPSQTLNRPSRRLPVYGLAHFHPYSLDMFLTHYNLMREEIIMDCVVLSYVIIEATLQELP